MVTLPIVKIPLYSDWLKLFGGTCMVAEDHADVEAAIATDRGKIKE